jgi:hypothetical protein
MRPPKKDNEGQARGGKYKYADLASVMDAVREPLSANGLSVTQAPTMNGDGFVLVSRLMHTSGQWLEATYPLSANVSSQEMGSAITYGRRYCTLALLGIAADEDDDGAQAKTPARSRPEARPAQPQDVATKPAPAHASPAMPAADPNVITEPQRKRLFAIAKEYNVDTAAVQAIISEITGQVSTSKIPVTQYDQVIDALGHYRPPTPAQEPTNEAAGQA